MCMSNQKRCTVAIADDHEAVRSCLQYMLSNWGYAVTILAANGNELIDRINGCGQPDICIIDINMPGMNGNEAIRVIREKWPGIRVLVYSMDAHYGSYFVPDIGQMPAVSKWEAITELKYALEKLRS